MHGGSVTVESVYGRGTMFRVLIPLGHGHLPQEQIGSARTLASTALGAGPFIEEALRWLPDAGHLLDLLVRQTADYLERKRAERTQQRLVEELNHRVKNTVASVQAIAQHTLRSAKTPAEFAAGFAGRIQSMARVHALLSGTTWQGVDLHDLVRDQVLSGPIDETRVTAWGPSVHLEPQMALDLALLLHELGTNSNKYGALLKAEGTVTISWAVNNDIASSGRNAAAQRSKHR